MRQASGNRKMYEYEARDCHSAVAVLAADERTFCIQVLGTGGASGKADTMGRNGAVTGFALWPEKLPGIQEYLRYSRYQAATAVNANGAAMLAAMQLVLSTRVLFWSGRS